MYVGLIRGINLGPAKRVAMADLRAMVEGFGYTGVRTLLASGNIVFEAPDASPADAAARIEEGLATELGVSARVTVFTADRLATIIAENPLSHAAENPSRLLVAVLMSPADRERLDPLIEEDWSPEALAVGTYAAYLWCPEGVRDSAAWKAIGKSMGDAVTTRNWSTLQKLHAVAGGSSD